MNIETFYDPATYTLTYVVFDEVTKDAIVIDPVLDYDPTSHKVTTESVKRINEFIQKNELNLHASLETHAHADHLTGSIELKKLYPHLKVIISEKIQDVQNVFKNIFKNVTFDECENQFDMLVKDGDKLTFGSILIDTIATPGHTPACVTYKINDSIFTGDALFMPDFGTGRCDFPSGSSSDLFDSITKLYQLPDNTRVFVGHDYQPGGRSVKFETTIGESKLKNIQLNASTTKEIFTKLRDQRDLKLAPPKLLKESIQVNINPCAIPLEHKGNDNFLRIPTE